MNKQLLCIVGPTATGKTNLAVSLAKRFDGELISADSRQVYRYMDIGTGKDKASLKGVPIYMYDVANPDEPFNVTNYKEQACGYIDNCVKRNKIPILVGGSGLYIHALLHPFTVSVGPNAVLRDELAAYTKHQLQEKLQEVGKKYWDALNESDRQNPRRLMRKIEIAIGGETELFEGEMPYDVLQIGLTEPLGVLYKRIDERVDERVKQGMIQEIQTLINKGYTWELPSMSGLGYRKWKPYIEGTATKEEVIRKWKYEEHAYARRQMTWFRKDKTIHWFERGVKGVEREIESLVRSWYTRKV